MCLECCRPIVASKSLKYKLVCDMADGEGFEPLGSCRSEAETGAANPTSGANSFIVGEARQRHGSRLSFRPRREDEHGTWVAVMREMAPMESRRHRSAARANLLLESVHKPLVQTTAEDLLSIVHNNGHSVAHYLRRLQWLGRSLPRGSGPRSAPSAAGNPAFLP